MISFARMDIPENQNTLAPSDSDETASKNEDFAFALSSLTSGFPANNSAINQTPDSPDSGEKVCNEVSTSIIGIASPPDFSTASTEINQSNFLTTQNLIANENGKAETSGEVQSLLALNQNEDKQNPQLIRKDEKSITKKAREFVKICLESGVAEVVKALEKTPFVSVSQNNFPAAENPLSPITDKTTLPQIFKEISGVFKNKETEKFQKSDSANAVFENQILSENGEAFSVKPNSNTNETAFDLSQSQIEIPKSKEQIKTDAETLSAAANFDKVLSTKVEKESVNSPLTDVRAEKVFEQIEPKMLQLLTLKSVETEKKILKMRLHPAELGTVEIRLEKDAVTGKLNAHFQTESETTKQILTQNLDQLRDSLQNSGWQIERLEISCNSSSTSAQGNPGENASPGRFEQLGNRAKKQSVSDNSSDDADDSNSLQSSRLLSVRA